MTIPAEPRTAAPTTTGAGVPEKPALEGLEDKWVARWKADDTYAFVRPASRAPVYSIDTPRRPSRARCTSATSSPTPTPI